MLKDNGEFDLPLFIDVIHRWVQVLDKSVDLAGYPSKELSETTMQFRDIGLGYCGMGALLMRLGYPYDSENGRLLAALITAVLTSTAYLRSAMLAEKYSSYPAFRDNETEHLKILELHHKHLMRLANKDKLKKDALFTELARVASGNFRIAHDIASKSGLRNAQLTVIAPTGTIGITMDCETTGIEPLFALETVKSLAGGGSLKQESESVKIAAYNLGMSEEKAKKRYPELFATAVGDNALTPQAHVDMVAAIQPFISGGISKTVNLPHSAEVSDIDDIYKRAFFAGVKCISVYRDGCKSQPLKENECKTCGDDEACDIR